MRITALIVAASAALALTACQKGEEQAPAASSEAVEASGVADPAAVNVSVDQAAADAQAAAEAAAAATMAPDAAAEPAPAAAPDAAH